MPSVGAILLSMSAALAAAAPSSPAAAAAANSRRAVEDSGPFQIYAYGTKIGGLSLFSSGGDAYFGDHTKMNDSNAAPVIFTRTDDNIWVGAPNTTALGSSATLPTWSNLTFSVPSTTSREHTVGFSNSSSSSSSSSAAATAASDRQTSGFMLYGSFVFVEDLAGGGMESLWYATPSIVDGVYNLRWNQTGDDAADKITLTLKKTAPSTA